MCVCVIVMVGVVMGVVMVGVVVVMVVMGVVEVMGVVGVMGVVVVGVVGVVGVVVGVVMVGAETPQWTTYHHSSGWVMTREKPVAHFIMNWCPLEVVWIEGPSHHNLPREGGHI